VNPADPYQLDPFELRRSFARAAASYDAAAPLQREIADRLLGRLDLIRIAPQAVLDAGCGTGYCARALGKRYRRAQLTGLDLVWPMLRHARSHDRWWRRNRWICGDIGRMPLAAGSFDLVLSSLALQWCDLPSALAELRRVLRPGGLLLFTTFGPDTLLELRSAWAEADQAPHVHGFIDMHDIGDALVRQGFSDPVMDCERLQMMYPDVPTLLQDLKHLGAHNVMRGRRATLTGKSRFARFRSAYEQLARDGRIPATWETIYGHAWAPAEAADGRSGEVAIPVSAIRRRRN
jgi:malonyl-CoA O-methyltransferase